MLHSADYETLPANKGKSVISSVVVLLSLAECEIFYALPYHVNKKNAIINWHFHNLSEGKFSCLAELSTKKVLQSRA